jgi:hypothetical protein
VSTPTAPDVCPGCDGKKSRRAVVCSSCRRAANAVGVSVLTHVHDAAIPPESRPFEPRTSQQSKVYHAKCADLAVLTARELVVVKKRALAHASTTIGRELNSSTELSEIEMELLLEWLDEEIAAARRRLELVR